MGLKYNIEKFILNKELYKVLEDPEVNLPKLMNKINRIMGDGERSLKKQREYFTKWVNDKNSPWHVIMMKVLKDTDKECVVKMFDNFFLNANLIGWKRQCRNREKYGCNVPWAVLLDPTSACNLHCTGCWAAEYAISLTCLLMILTV